MSKSTSVEDIVLIQQIAAISSHAIDGLLPPESLAECFTPDGRMTVQFADGKVVDTAEGHARLFKFCETISASNNTRRWGMNPVIKVDGDTATMLLYGAVVSIDAQARSIMRTSHQVSTLVRTPDGWRISAQVLTLDPGVALPSGDATTCST